MSGNEDNQSLSEGIFPAGYKHEFPEISPSGKTSWEPWHKPRKFWLRQNQWNAEIETLFDSLRLQDRPLIYFSLPGDDLLDFRSVIELCKQKNVTVKLVGFNDCQRSEDSRQVLEIAKNEVFSNDVVRESSDIHADFFQNISDSNSIAFKFANEKGPYDIINLDLCGSFSGINQQGSHYEATCKLFNLQVQNRAEPWLFLLTTRADKQQVNPADIPSFWKNIETNIMRSSEFKQYLEKDYLSQKIDETDFPANVNNLPSPNFEKLFGMLLSKWLLKIMHSTHVWSVSLLDSYWYRTDSADNGMPNMLSLAFLFRRQPTHISDATGLAHSHHTQQVSADKDFEVEQAIEILKKMNKLTDLDRYLHENPEVFSKCVKTSANCLKNAGYDVDGYEHWATSMIPSILKQNVAS